MRRGHRIGALRTPRGPRPGHKPQEGEASMKITAVEITPVEIPMKHAYGEAASVPAAVASIQTDEGINGVGHVITLYGRQFELLVAAARELAAQIIGDDPRYPERIHKKILPGGPG